jgi:hypothetical protein
MDPRTLEPELFFSLPNVETFHPQLIDDDHLRGIFRVIDMDRCADFDVFPRLVFADSLHRAVRFEVIGAAYRVIPGRSWSRRKAVAAFANVPLHLKTTKRNRLVFLPVMPNTLHQTEGFRRFGEVCGWSRVYALEQSIPERSIRVVVDVFRHHNEQHGHRYGHHVTEALSLGLILSLHVSRARDARWRFGHAITPHPLLSEERRKCYDLVHMRNALQRALESRSEAFACGPGV